MSNASSAAPTAMGRQVSLKESYRLCNQIARREGRNFYYSFLVLPRQQRAAMSALYAFLRRTDDVGDSDQPAEERRAALQQWRAALDAALAGEHVESPLLPALVDTVARYRIPAEHLHAVIDGVMMDIDGLRCESFEQLADYCKKVASAVGLCCIHIWGFRGPQAIEPAVKCGIAFQLTNILRDLREDALQGRVYLPADELERFHYTADDLRLGRRDQRFHALMRFQIDRAEQFYREGAELARWLEPGGRKVLGAMSEIYHSLLEEIARRQGDVFSSRVQLSGWRKLSIAARWLWPRPPGSRADRATGAGL